MLGLSWARGALRPPSVCWSAGRPAEIRVCVPRSCLPRCHTRQTLEHAHTSTPTQSHRALYRGASTCICVRACVRACMRACVRANAGGRLRARDHARANTRAHTNTVLPCVNDRRDMSLSHDAARRRRRPRPTSHQRYIALIAALGSSSVPNGRDHRERAGSAGGSGARKGGDVRLAGVGSESACIRTRDGWPAYWPASRPTASRLFAALP